MSVPAFLGYISAAIAVVSFIGVAFVYLRGSADKGTIESQGRLIKSLQEENADLIRKTTNLTERVAAVEAENGVLRSAVGHTEEVKALQSTLDVHHRESMQAWATITGTLERIAS